MFEQKCKISNLLLTTDGKCALTVIVPRSFLEQYDDYKDKDLRLKLCLWRNKRSLDANNYFWELCGQLSAKLRIPPKDIYRSLIKEVGGNYQVTPHKDKALEAWISNWESRGLGWVCEIIGKSRFEGYTNVKNYFGSSTYDTVQMSRLIELLVIECKNNDIDTALPKFKALYEDSG